jgi:hypothetical protein
VGKARGFSSRRCSICAIEWPTDDEFKTCPLCEEDTWRHREGKPISKQEVEELTGVAREDSEPEPYDQDVEEAQEIMLDNFRRWLDSGIGPDDFARSIPKR